MKQTTIKLTTEQVKFLKEFKEHDKRSVREINRANILLLLNRGKLASEIAEFLDIGRNTVSRTKQKFLRDGVESALEEGRRTGQPVIHTAANGGNCHVVQRCSNGENQVDIGIIDGNIKSAERI